MKLYVACGLLVIGAIVISKAHDDLGVSLVLNIKQLYLFVCSIFILLSEKETVALYFGRILHPLRGCPFSSFSSCFFDFLPLNLLLI